MKEMMNLDTWHQKFVILLSAEGLHAIEYNEKEKRSLYMLAMNKSCSSWILKYNFI